MPEITETGARLVAISPQLPEHSRRMVERHRLTFDVLYDGGNKVARQFGLVFTLPADLRDLYRKFGTDLLKFNGDESWSLPMPARYIIDQNSMIRSAEVNPDYTVRPDPRMTIEALTAMADKK